MLKSLVILSLCLLCHAMSASDPRIDSLKKLGREKLIDLAIRKLNEPAFDPDQYDRIIVKASKESLVVEFRLAVVVKSKRRCYYDAVFVALAGQGGGRSIEGDCDEPEYYRRSFADQKKILFVFNAINKSDEIGHITDNTLPSGTSMEITDHGTYYEVVTDSWSTHSSFKVSTLTGRISDATHKHYARRHDEKDEFEVIQFP